MTPPVEQAVKKQQAAPAVRADTYFVRPGEKAGTADQARAGADAMDFVRANRIHVKDGSLFIDPYLVIHPRELDPKNETALREKLQLTYSINNPSFFESPERVAISLNLGQLVPVSLNAKRSKLVEEVKKFNAQVDSGSDVELSKQASDKHAPLTAIVRDMIDNPEADPVGMELLKNGLAIYLMVREKLTQNHFLKRETDYVQHSSTPDQVLQDLSDKIGVTPREVRDAALKGGVDGVGKLLGLEPKYIADVKALTEHAASHDFGYNLIEHWHIGRQLLGLEAPLSEKLAKGMEARITAKIHEYRGRVDKDDLGKSYFDVPDPIRAEEARIASEDMSVLEPIQRQLMFALGYEICHTPENTADSIAFHKGIYGLHRKAANDLNDIDGTYRIYYGTHGSREKSVGTLAHEVAHNMWPRYFSKQAVTEIDRLAGNDASGFAQLQHLLDEKFTEFETLHRAYKAGSAEEKAAVIAAANEQFANYGITVDELFPHLADAKSFRNLLWDANNVLHVEGARYNTSGYDTPQERFREVISRYAEMRQVSHRHEPEVMKYLTPGLSKIWEEYYIPHLEQVYQDVLAHKRGGAQVRGANARPANDTAPIDEQTIPKVDERAKGMPAKPAVTAEKSAEPSTSVISDSMHIDENKLAALDALRSMDNFPH